VAARAITEPFPRPPVYLDEGLPPAHDDERTRQMLKLGIRSPRPATGATRHRRPTPGVKVCSATFAAGCFWGVEAAFREIEGVVKTTVDYTGGISQTPPIEYFRVAGDVIRLSEQAGPPVAELRERYERYQALRAAVRDYLRPSG
jgi:Peptide methionine sulfoxide reductase